MKILRVIASMDPASGGPCQGIRNTIFALSELGIENEVACLDEPGSDFAQKDNFTIHLLGPASNPWAYSSKMLPWLVHNLKRFDVVIVHGLWLYPTYAVKKAMDSLKKENSDAALPQWYIMPHGMLDPYFQLAPERKLKALRNNVYWRLIESKVINSAHGLLFTCQQELLLARKTFKNYKPARELNVGYGILPPPQYDNSLKAAFESHFNVPFANGYYLFLSRIHVKKGVDNLIEAYKKTLQSESDKLELIPHLVIAGPGLDSDFGREILTRVESDSLLKTRVHFPGMLKGDAKWGAFYGCEAFILPSHQENFGIAVAEALACGKAVLISDKINIWREIADSGGGLVENDTESGTLALFNRWQALTTHEKEEMSIKAFDTYDRYFKIKSNIKKLIQVLENHVVTEN